MDPVGIEGIANEYRFYRYLVPWDLGDVFCLLAGACFEDSGIVVCHIVRVCEAATLPELKSIYAQIRQYKYEHEGS